MKSTEMKTLRSNVENSQNDAADISLSENEKLKLIHELQVHQIELESQNVELQRLKQEADFISNKYTELYDFAPSAYFTVSEYGSIEELNLTGAKMLGMDRVLLSGKILSHFVTTATKADFELFLQQLFKSHSTECCEVSITSYRQKHYDLYLSGIAKEGEEHCFITAVDISERKTLEEDLVLAKERAEESDRLKTAFLQNMSHEIRSPLNAIKGFSQLLVKNHDNKEKLDKYTRIIDQRSDDLLGIINDLLDIAKIESGQLTVNLEKCHLKSLMDDLSLQFKEVQNRLNKQHITFEMIITDLPEDTTFISDGAKLKQIFINLLTNAF
ncbi:MAG TPA: histidine kinase dimerization/phospho-acceptor domain-containing protein, partial [Bacteroidales bacterium]|nr:histidine kinase dimerization/phospho-acceptor domain-containing protein [Bacteroidales bacterium]